MTVTPPKFLIAIDNVDQADDRTYTGECPICRDILLIAAINHTWELICDGGCTHDELVNWLHITDLRANTRTPDRAWVALMLATTPDTWHALLNGEPVAEEALDQQWAARFRKAGIL